MEAIPGGTTLGGRTNIILTSDKNILMEMQ